MAILGIDPGTRKCGYAIVAAIGAAPLELGIEPTERLAERARDLVLRYAPTTIALGRGTHASVVGGLLADLGIPIALVDETETTLLARKRYFAANPPPWWLRIVPVGMRLPPRPIDDFAAVLIAERLLAQAP
jgi:RNase H-fold protein (predicted Holliday junction resolvase)